MFTVDHRALRQGANLTKGGLALYPLLEALRPDWAGRPSGLVIFLLELAAVLVG